MSAIASHLSFSLRKVVLPGALLLSAWTLSVATSHSPSLTAAAHSGKHAGAHAHTRWYQLGRASWYGTQFQGQATASGEAFDMNGMTCAHRSLPLGALVRVTNLHNHRSVVVRVNDRGPVLRTRVIDLSYAAARVIGFRGMARVRVDLVDASPTAAETARLTWPDSERP